MKKEAFYNWDTAPKADSVSGYGIFDHAGIVPGMIPLPATNKESSTALLVGLKRKAKKNMKKTAAESLAKGFAEEVQKLGFGMMGGGMSSGISGGMMAHGGVVTSKSKKSLGPRIKVISSKARKTY